jgi:hypothetical protein
MKTNKNGHLLIEIKLYKLNHLIINLLVNMIGRCSIGNQRYLIVNIIIVHSNKTLKKLI